MKKIELTDDQFDMLVNIIEKSISRNKRKINNFENALHDPFLPSNDEIDAKIKDDLAKSQQKLVDKIALLAILMKSKLEDK